MEFQLRDGHDKLFFFDTWTKSREFYLTHKPKVWKISFALDGNPFRLLPMTIAEIEISGYNKTIHNLYPELKLMPKETLVWVNKPLIGDHEIKGVYEDSIIQKMLGI